MGRPAALVLVGKGGIVEQLDVVIIGGGAMGSAAAWQVAKTGRSVALLEAHAAGHTLGSSHGGSRIYRATYVQPEYLRLMQEALPLWDELESESGAQLLTRVGVVSHGFPPHDFEAPMRAYGIDLEVLTPADAQERWPAMRFEGKVLFEQDTAGRVNADRTIEVLQALAQRAGAVVRHESPVLAARGQHDGVVVVTQEKEYLAQRVVLATGGWLNTLATELLDLPQPLPLQVVEVAPVHFQIALGPGNGPSGQGSMTEANWPSFTHDHAPTNPVTGAPTRWPGIVYGLATDGEGIKVGFNAYGKRLTADTRTFTPREGDIELHQAYAREWLPGLDTSKVEALSCTYTRTPSDDFVLDRRGRVIVASCCSGHGFKFTPKIGALIAELVAQPLDQVPAQSEEIFSLSRYI